MKPTKKVRERERTIEVTPGVDSDFYLIEKRLMDAGYSRSPGETLSGWVKRIETNTDLSTPAEPLKTILALHYRYRFDPDGIAPSERNKLKSLVQERFHACDERPRSSGL